MVSENGSDSNKKRRRVIKKLIRKQPVSSNSTNVDIGQENAVDTTPTPVPRRKRRRKVKIKKKKRLLIPIREAITDANYLKGLEEHGQQATKPRRKIVITRKRLLPNKSKTLSAEVIETSSVTEEILSTKMMMQNSDYDIQIEKGEVISPLELDFDRSQHAKNLKESLQKDNVDENEDRTEENLIEDEQLTKHVDDINTGKKENNENSNDSNNTTLEEEGNNEDNDDEEDEEELDEDEDEYEDEDDDHYESEYDELEEDEDTEDDDKFEDSDETEEYDESNDDDKENTGRESENGEVSEQENVVEGKEETNQENEINTPSYFQSLPEYEPFFPELSDSIQAPVLLIKTTVLSSVELITKTITTTKLQTYTLVVTRVAGNEEIITSTTEVKPQIKTTTVTESSTVLTTLTLLDLDNMDKTDVQPTFLPTLEYNPSSLLVSNSEDNPDFREEPRNLATRVMSNGVEVIVAGDKTSYPGDKDFKRILPSVQKPVTLKPSTLTDHMMLMLPQETSIVENPTMPLDPNQFVVKTCLTTFTYLTTYLEKGTTTVSSHEQVVSNVATEERMNTGKILPTPAMGVTLTQYPTLSVGVFHTTYTYLNTILDGEQPLVISSQHVVANTVTAPDDYLSLLKPSEVRKPTKDTNTYFSTIDLEKTLYEDGRESVISTREVVTQVVITESIPPRDRPVMTSYIALDTMQDKHESLVKDTKVQPSTTDVTKTYFVTYTYFNTILENGIPTVYTNISTESDVVTEKVLLQPKKTLSTNINNTTRATDQEDPRKEKPKDQADSVNENSLKFDIVATKVYYTTFTYFTTLMKENDPKGTTIINSRTKVVENTVTDTLKPDMFNPEYLSSLSSDLKSGSGSIQKLATLPDGQIIDITVIANEKHNEIKPTKVLPIEKTEMAQIETTSDQTEPTINTALLEGSFSTSKPNIVTGSTIVFIDDDPFANLVPTPSLSSATKFDLKKPANTLNNNLGSILASEVVKETKINVVTSKVKRHKTKTKNKDKVSPTKTALGSVSSSTETNIKKTDKNKKQSHPAKITSTKQPVTPASDLLGLGSININTLQALTPVLNAMAGYINKNLKSTRRNDVNTTITQAKNPLTHHVIDAEAQQTFQNKKDNTGGVDAQNRSPVYIPVGGIVGDDFEIAESQNIATFEWNDSPGLGISGKVKHEAPLLGNNGIPISPGDIITANSDVIVGKPGRVAPRLPSSIPLHHEVPIGMKPPPPPESQKNWGNKHKNIGQRPQIPLEPDSVPAQTNIIHAPNKDDYVGPPPPPRQTKDKFRGDKRKHIPLAPPPSHVNAYKQNNFNVETQHKLGQNQQGFSENRFNFNELGRTENLVLIENQNNYVQKLNKPGGNGQQNIDSKYAPQYSGEKPPPYQFNQPTESFGQNSDQNLQDTINKNYDFESQNQNYPPVYAANQNPLIEPSISIVLPEVIERSTGQPLLVQLQPSQVAFVNIPFNRTTALIYGGSTETHHNGQYFDDPSPYPDPELNPAGSFKEGVQQIDSVYHGTPQLNHVNQKQVSGVITVGSSLSQTVNIDSETSANQKVPLKINPTKPNDVNNLVKFVNSDININVPPLSFGMTEQNGDVNGHIINHGDITVRVPSIPLVVYNGSNDRTPTNMDILKQNIFELPQRPQYQNHELTPFDQEVPVFQNNPTRVQNAQPYPNEISQQNYVAQQPTLQHTYPPDHPNNLIRNQNKPSYHNELSQEILPPQNPPVYPEEPTPNNPRKPNPFKQNKPKYPHPPKRNLLRPRPRPDRPKIGILEYMSPPPITKKYGLKGPAFEHRPAPSKDPLRIPLFPDGQQFESNEFNQFETHQNIPGRLPSLQPNSDEVFPVFDPQKVPNRTPEGMNLNGFTQNNRNPAPNNENINFNKYHHQNIHKEVTKADIEDLNIEDDHLEDDMPNEDGEVVQESKHRPLKPGEIPIEVIRQQAKSTTEAYLDLIRFPDSFRNSTQVRFPYNQIQYPRPEFILPEAKPFENGNIQQEVNFIRPQVQVDVPIRVPPPRPVYTNQDQTYFSTRLPPKTTQYGGFTKKPANGFNVGTKDKESQSQTEENTLAVSQRPLALPSQTPVVQFATPRPVFGQKTKVTTKITFDVSTQKPILIFVDENGEKKDNFFLKNGNKNTRPKVTSLPIDTQTVRVPFISLIPNISTVSHNLQTEKPFDGGKYPVKQQTNEVNIVVTDKALLSTNITTIAAESTTQTKAQRERVTTPPSIYLNSGENFGVVFTNITQQINNMEVLQPPPLIEEIPKRPSIAMEPPKIDVNSPGHDIVRVPHIKNKQSQDQEENASTLRPFVPQPLEEMVPPPPDNRSDGSVPTTEIVLGMNPPPLISTHKPIISSGPPVVPAINNIFSMEIDIPTEPQTTNRAITKPIDRITRPRPPLIRRKPGYRRTTTTSTVPPYISSSSTKRSTTQQGYFKTKTSTTLKPVKITSYGILLNRQYNKNKETPSPPFLSDSYDTFTSTESMIAPTPTIKSIPSLEIIVGQPNLDLDSPEKNDVKDNRKHEKTATKQQNDSTTKETVSLGEHKYGVSKESSSGTSGTTKATPELITVPQDLNDIVTKPVHHAGNEIMIVDEPERPVTHSTSTSSKDGRSTILPTRYITHTKTHTVTITKTTVVKTLGGPPSTLTLLVTKTEKSYIIDTVTEFHTLVQPTSITETVTTTIENKNALYPSDAYENSYPRVQVNPTLVAPNRIKPSVVTENILKPTIISSGGNGDIGFNGEDDDDDSLEDFIIKDADDFVSQDKLNENAYDSNESIFVVMTDKNKGGIVKIPPQNTQTSKEEDSNHQETSNDHPHRDEITNNEVNNVLLGGILIANHPQVNAAEPINEKNDRCNPECKPSRNELCQKVKGSLRCVCRPGFARMFPDRPCRPTYTYSLNITIEKLGRTPVKYSEQLSMENSTDFITMARKTHDGLDRMVMQSDLRDIYHGVHVTSFHPIKNISNDEYGVISKFYLQLSDNIDENRMEDIFKKYLRNNNYSLGGTEVLASPQMVHNFKVQDFNECENPKFHDCSENSQCFNLRGTYTCSCREGYSDLSENMLYPGRICSAEQVGCEKCNYHGTCYSRGSEAVLCECFHWYAGEFCQLNLKVLLIALVTLGTILFALLLVCIILTCVRKKPKKAGVTIGFLPHRVSSSGNRGETLDRRAMIEDTSSEDSRSETNTLPPYVQQKPLKLRPPPPKGALKKVSKVSMTSVEHNEPGVIFPDQKDRSLTVMIPRAKYHPAPPTSPILNYTTFDARKPSVPSINNEAKLLSYLDAGPSPNKSESKRKYSNSVSEPYIEENPSSRKTSGALISAGFEVSATVINTMGTLGTTCGTEADRSENATLIHKISADLLSRADTSSQFNTLRKSLVDDDLESSSNWMDIPRIRTESDSRSYDETTIPPPMKSFTRSEYDSKSLQHQNDEANTMAERDLGSTFMLPHTHLYKPDRGSDISGFESL